VLTELKLDVGLGRAGVAAVTDKYMHVVGGREDVHYRAFCRDLDLLVLDTHAAQTGQQRH
jgi:hypothetical protein